MLPKKHRISKNFTFNFLKREGKSYKSDLFSVLYIKDLGLETGQFGVVVSKKVSPISPKRNRAKRVFRSLIYENLRNLKGWFVFYPKSRSLSTPKSLLLQEILAFKKHFEGYNN